MNEFEQRFTSLSDEELVAILKEDVSKPGWVAARGRFYAALRAEFNKRGIDYPVISNKNNRENNE
jgi:hypothetical protein